MTDQVAPPTHNNVKITIHIVEDNRPLRDAIRDMLKARLERLDLPVLVDDRCEYVWKLYDSPTVRAGDIAICDLYPSGYWDKVPKPTLYPRSEPLGDDVENMMKASLDVARRFFRRLQHQKGVDVFVITFIPNFFEAKGYTKQAETVRQALTEQNLAGVLEKRDQTTAKYNYEEVVDAAIERARERSRLELA